MKIKSILLAGLIALGFMACNNEEVPQIDGANGSLSVKVMPASKGATRLSGDLSDPGIEPGGLTAESAVKKTQVWVFFGDLLDGYGISAGDAVTDIPVHVGQRDIYIVVNGAGLDKFTPKADIEAALTTVPVNIGNDGLVMTAEKITKILVPDKNTIGYGASTSTATSLQDGPVIVERVNARVAIVSTKLALTDPNQLDIFDDLAELEVAMFNVNEKANIFNPNTASGKWLYGQAWPASATTYEQDAASSSVKGDFLQTVTMGSTDLIEIANAPYFYVNPLETVNKMFIVLRGKPVKDGNTFIAKGLYTDEDGFTYFPVWINGKDLGYDFGSSANEGTGTVLRNTQYNISLTIKKIGNPTIDEIEEAFLDVKVEVKPWEVVTQDVTWQ